MSDVQVYSKPNCSKCTMLKRWLGSKHIDYSEVDITQDPESLDEIIRENRRSMPQIKVDGEFRDYETFNELLEYIK